MTTVLRLITSAAYVDQELAAEFGRIPPAFLPIGVKPLYEAQVAGLGSGDPIYLTVPDDFVCKAHDCQRLNDLGVTLIPVPIGLSLGASVIYAINYVDPSPGPVFVLHGDTFISDLPQGLSDVVATHAESDNYSWAVADITDGNITRFVNVMAGNEHDTRLPVVCGAFHFSSRTLLVKSIVRARNEFVAGLNLYAQERSLKSLPVEGWHDFGHIQTYFRSRRRFSTTRSFNSIDANERTVLKSSNDSHKINAEAHWFISLPPAVRPYSARLISRNEPGESAAYELEYIYAPTLAELFVFASIGRSTWRKIILSCQDFLRACRSAQGPETAGKDVIGMLTSAKTASRLEEYASLTGFDITCSTTYNGRRLPSLLAIGEDVANRVTGRPGAAQGVMHGDFCFSNILYNSRAGRVAVIDPRGYVEPDTASIYGDFRYDMAKLAHSAIGRYDHILAGRYRLNTSCTHAFDMSFDNRESDRWLEDAFADIEVEGVRLGSTEVRAITVGLFLSMLPLHADRPDRQSAFIANALRLYSGLIGTPR